METEITSANLIGFAHAELNRATKCAYRAYTDAAIKVAPAMYSDFDAYEKIMKTERARLSQLIGAANKSAKGMIIQFYAEQFSAAEDLDMSVREADDIFKKVIGRSMSKKMWKGLFNRTENDISPYFTDREYRACIFKHNQVIALKAHMEEFEAVLDVWRKTRKNPYQNKLDRELKLIKESM
ncbi:MAG: hypothetical protein ACI9T7_000496 [Oleiphilaceae bacterium]|jgi:hypothetical protein